MATNSTLSYLNTLCVNCLRDFKGVSTRWRKFLVPAGLLILILGIFWAIQSSEIKLLDLQLGPLLILFLFFPFISIIYGVFGLRILASITPNKPKIAFWSAFKINALAEVSQILPIPAASTVRAGALTSKGVNVGYSVSLVVFSALSWISLAMIFAGGAVVFNSSLKGLVLIGFGLTVLLPVSFWILHNAGSKITLAFLAHKILGLFITAARIYVSFAALSIALSYTSSFIFSLAVIAGSTVAITPAGVGISEIFGALLSELTIVSPAIAFLAIAVDRLTSLMGFALIAGVTLLFKDLKAPANEKTITASTNACFITRKWPPSMGGMETYSKRLSEELGKLTDVHVIFLPGRLDGHAEYNLPLVKFGFVTAYKLVRRSPSEITHFGDMAIWPLALFARLRSRSTKLFVSVHGTDVSYSLRTGFKGKLYGAYLKLGAFLLPSMTVIANSNATAEVAKKHGFSRISVIPLGTDTLDDVTPVKFKNNNNIFFAGRIIELKGLSWFVGNVLPLLPSATKLRVAGTIWDTKESKVLEHPQVVYLGQLSQDDLRKEFAKAFCVIMPNINTPQHTFEGFGLIALEAAGAGGVVVASKHGGLVDAVIDGKTGFHLEAGNAAEWQKKIIEIQNWSAATRIKFVTDSISRIKSHFSWSRVATQTLKVYKKEN